MPAPWARGATARITGTIHGQDYNNVLNFATNQVVNDPIAFEALLVQLAAAILDCLVTTLLPAATSDFTLLGVEVRPIHPQPGDPIFAAAPANSVGQQGATSNSFTATLVHWRTGTGGKSGRGRTFLPPPGEAQMTNSTVDGPAQTNFREMVTCILGKFTGAGATEDWRLGVLSTKKVGDPPALPAFDARFREVIGGDVSADQSVMSSRKRGSGR